MKECWKYFWSLYVNDNHLKNKTEINNEKEILNTTGILKNEDCRDGWVNWTYMNMACL